MREDAMRVCVRYTRPSACEASARMRRSSTRHRVFPYSLARSELRKESTATELTTLPED